MKIQNRSRISRLESLDAVAQATAQSNFVDPQQQFNTTLVNGNNSNIPTNNKLVVRIGGPTSNFSIGGFSNPSGWMPGQRVVLVNTTNQQATVVNNDTNSKNGNRIFTPHAVPISMPPRGVALAFIFDDTIDGFIQEHTGFRYDQQVDPRDYGADVTGVIDSTVAIQSAINTAVAQQRTVYMPGGTFLLSAPDANSHALTIPLNMRGAWSVCINGQGWGDGSLLAGGNRTTLVANSPMKSILNVVATDVRVQGIKLLGSSLSTYGMYCQGVSLSTFNVMAYGCIVDGIHLAEQYDGSGGSSIGEHCINDNCEFHRCWCSQNGKLFATSGIIAQYAGCGSPPGPILISGTATTVAGSATISFSGSPDLTTLGIRIGDVIRLGTALDSTTKFYQVASVTSSNTILTGGTASFRPTTNSSNIDFAISIGDGYHEVASGDNNNSLINGGVFEGNAGYGLIFAGLYGPHVIGATLTSANAGACVGVGYGGGEPSFHANVLDTKIDKIHCESTFPNFIIGDAQGIRISEPVLSGNSFGDFIFDPVTVSGTWEGRDASTNNVGEFPLGLYLNTVSTIPVNRIVNATSEQLFGYVEQQPTVTGTGFQFDATQTAVSFFVSGGPWVLTGTAIAKPPASRTYSSALFLHNNGASNVTIPQSSTVKCLNGVSSIMTPGSTAQWMYWTSVGAWIQMTGP